jgi:hypothetical protein
MNLKSDSGNSSVASFHHSRAVLGRVDPIEGTIYNAVTHSQEIQVIGSNGTK